jgi:hypothetical protein
LDDTNHDWFAAIGIVHNPEPVLCPSNGDIQTFELPEPKSKLLMSGVWKTDFVTGLVDKRCIFRVPYLMLAIIHKILPEIIECGVPKEVIQDDLHRHTHLRCEGRWGVCAENWTHIIVLKTLAVK